MLPSPLTQQQQEEKEMSIAHVLKGSLQFRQISKASSLGATTTP